MAEVIGLQGLLNDMGELPRVLQRKLVAKALRAGGEPVETRAKQLAPDDPETPFSRIEENIKTMVSEQTAEGAVAYIGPTKRGFMGQFAELGTAHQQATPFLGPAYDENEDRAYEIIGEVLGEGIEKHLKK